MVDSTLEKFWGEFLRKLPTRTNLHASSKVSKSNNLAQNAGYPHIDYRYLPRKNSTAVALFINLGDKDKNWAIFHRLYKHKEEIEAAFGGPLEWDPYPKSRNVKVQKRVTQVGVDAEDQWDETMDQMIDAMIRLEKAFGPYVDKLNEGK